MAVAALLITFHIGLDPVLDGLRGKTFDLYQNLAPEPSTTDDIVLITIDDAALAREGRWPWPRTRIAELIACIGAAHPSAFGIDILFPDAGDALGDAALASAIETVRPVLAMSTSEVSGAPLPEQKAGWSVVGNGNAGTIPHLPGLLASRPDFASQAGGLGLVRSVPDPDGVTRSIPMIWATGTESELEFWPSMALELARIHMGEPDYTLRLGPQGYDALRLGNRTISLSSGGAVWLADSASPIARVGALDLLAGTAAQALAGKIAILSVTATGFDSFHTTPLVATRPGAEIHALLTGQILSGRFPVEPANAKLYERLAFALLALTMIAAVSLMAERRLALLAAFVLLAGTPFAVGLAAYAWRGELYDGLQPSIGLAALAAALTYLLYRLAERRRQRISGQFALYLSPKVVEALVRSDTDVTRTAERRLVTVMFMDLRGFTASSETLPPDQVVGTVNRFLTIASEEIFRTDGTIDKFMGDAVMAFWNAPLDQPDHASRAMRSVTAIVDRLREENIARKSAGLAQILVGAGLESGPCSVGNFGSDIRYNFTVIGQAANLAARLESATKGTGHTVLAGPGFARQVPELVAPAGQFTLAGFAQSVEAFTLRH
ncbi:CHASE2 domain-containing protein [Hoeflea marina]|nr:adenylate/guanylate cyclase domain-containing protein [Hoeflea marina]